MGRGVSSWGNPKATSQRSPAGSTPAHHPLWLASYRGKSKSFSPKASPTHFSLGAPLLHASNSSNALITQGHWLLPIQLDPPLTELLLSLCS